MAGSCIFQFSLETASVGAVKAHVAEGTEGGSTSFLVLPAAFLFDSKPEIHSAKEWAYSDIATWENASSFRLSHIPRCPPMQLRGTVHRSHQAASRAVDCSPRLRLRLGSDPGGYGSALARIEISAVQGPRHIRSGFSHRSREIGFRMLPCGRFRPGDQTVRGALQPVHSYRGRLSPPPRFSYRLDFDVDFIVRD